MIDSFYFLRQYNPDSKKRERNIPQCGGTIINKVETDDKVLATFSFLSGKLTLNLECMPSILVRLKRIVYVLHANLCLSTRLRILLKINLSIYSKTEIQRKFLFHPLNLCRLRNLC